MAVAGELGQGPAPVSHRGAAGCYLGNNPAPDHACLVKEDMMAEKIVIVRAVQTSSACPSQWDAWDSCGNYYYLRFRHGCGAVTRYSSEHWYHSDEPGECEMLGRVAEFQDEDDPWNGVITLEEFAERAGLELAPGLYHTDFGQHLRDGLIELGITSLVDGSGDPLAGEGAVLKLRQPEDT
jgi:hypothetical protein